MSPRSTRGRSGDSATPISANASSYCGEACVVSNGTPGASSIDTRRSWTRPPSQRPTRRWERSSSRRSAGTCHTLFGKGGKIAQDLTGSDRRNIDYILLNVLAPSAEVPDEYRLRTFVTKEGRTISGIVKERTKTVIEIQTVGEIVVLSPGDVIHEEKSESSLMPEGLLTPLSEEQLRDLMGFIGD